MFSIINILLELQKLILFFLFITLTYFLQSVKMFHLLVEEAFWKNVKLQKKKNCQVALT